MFKDSLTAILLTILLGLGLFIYKDWNTACSNGTPEVSTGVRDYINSEIAKTKSAADQTSDSKPLAELTDRTFKLQAAVLSIEGAVNANVQSRQNTPPELTDFPDMPVNPKERSARTSLVLGESIAQVGRACNGVD